MDRKLQMLTAYIAQLVATEPDMDFITGMEYDYAIESLHIRFGDEGFEYSWGADDNWAWLALETVSQLKSLLWD